MRKHKRRHTVDWRCWIFGFYWYGSSFGIYLGPLEMWWTKTR